MAPVLQQTPPVPTSPLSDHLSPQQRSGGQFHRSSDSPCKLRVLPHCSLCIFLSQLPGLGLRHWSSLSLTVQVLPGSGEKSTNSFIDGRIKALSFWINLVAFHRHLRDLSISELLIPQQIPCQGTFVLFFIHPCITLTASSLLLPVITSLINYLYPIPYLRL